MGVTYLRDLGFIQAAADMDGLVPDVSVNSLSNVEQVGRSQSEIMAEEEDGGHSISVVYLLNKGRTGYDEGEKEEISVVTFRDLPVIRRR
jgi:hypothetical protein